LNPSRSLLSSWFVYYFRRHKGLDQTKLNQKSRSTIIKQKRKTLKEKDFVFVVHPFLYFFIIITMSFAHQRYAHREKRRDILAVGIYCSVLYPDKLHTAFCFAFAF